MSAHVLEFGGEGRAVRSFHVPASEQWSVRIGSAGTCDLPIVARGVEPQHCDLWSRNGKIFLEDLGTNGGTWVDGKRLDFPARLSAGMSFRCGDVSFRLVALSTEQPAAAVSDVTIVADASNPSRAEPDRARRVLLTGDRLVLGRDGQGGGRIDDVQVSRRHAEVRRSGDAWQIRDLGSTNGTFVNGAQIDRWVQLSKGDRVSLGSVEFEFTGRALKGAQAGVGVRVDVLHLTKSVAHRDTGRPIDLIADVSVTVLPGEFVAILGSSGCGKSTFVDAINGRRRATKGRILYNGRSLYDEFPALKRLIGYVPQDVILHQALDVGDALRYACRLRLPTDTTEAEVEENIDHALRQVGLSERKRTAISALSGGQRKRVSIAAELLSRPSVLFLDEVTSGLDASTEREMMKLFRGFADEGLTVFCITHCLDNLNICDHLAYFCGGRLVFFGPESEFRNHFGIAENAEIYTLEKGEHPASLAERYERSPVGRRLLHDRLAEVLDDAPPVDVDSNAGAEQTRVSAERFGLQTVTLTKRYVKLLTADRTTLAITLAFAPGAALLIAFAAQDWPSLGGVSALNTAFIAIVTSFFLGLFTSVREIVKELPIFLHERMVGLEIMPYLLSKIAPLFLIDVIQVACLLLCLVTLTDLGDVAALPQLALIVIPVSFVGTLMGLAISSAVRRVEAALSVMICAVIPQLAFAGNLAPVQGPREVLAKVAITTYWAYQSVDALHVPAAPATQVNQPAAGGPGAGGAPAVAPATPPAPFQVAPQRARFWQWFGPTTVIWLQGGALFMLTFLLVLRRDGPGAIRRFLSGAGRVIQTQTTAERIKVKDLVDGARAGLLKG